MPSPKPKSSKSKPVKVPVADKPVPTLVPNQRSFAERMEGKGLSALPLTQVDVYVLDEINTMLLRVQDTGWALSFARVTFNGRIGGDGEIAFSICNGADHGSLPFTSSVDCLSKLKEVQRWAKAGRRT